MVTDVTDVFNELMNISMDTFYGQIRDINTNQLYIKNIRYYVWIIMEYPGL